MNTYDELKWKVLEDALYDFQIEKDSKLYNFLIRVINDTYDSIVKGLDLDETFGNVYQNEANARIRKNLSDWKNK